MIGHVLSVVEDQPSLSACDEPFDDPVGRAAGFSLHAGVAAKAQERRKLERLYRYISRPAVSEKRLSLTPNGNVRYQLKTPHRNGTPHVIFEPLDFVARLAALAPKTLATLAGQALEEILAWLDSECGITLEFGVVEGRFTLRCRDIIR